jgi:hypothetical protein
MSTTDSAQGSIKIDPPISWAELEGHPEFVTSGDWRDDHRREAWLKVEETRTRTSEGVLVRRTATHIVPREPGEGDRWELPSHVQDIWEAYRYAPDGTPREFTGEIRVQGECMGDKTPNVWRVVMVANAPRTERPKLLWPDGTKEEC